MAGLRGEIDGKIAEYVNRVVENLEPTS